MRTTTLVCAMLAAICMQAQSIATDFDKKVIATDSLNMPRHTSAMKIITLLPELLQRPGDYILSNYDVQIEGMSVSKAADVVLSELQIADVEKIEVIESPVASYLNNGQGGSINFVLRTSGEQGTALWGSAGMSASTFYNLAPQLNIGYHKGKFMVRGLVVGELAESSSTVHTDKFMGENFIGHSAEERNSMFRTEMARAYLQYDFTEHDILKLNLSENFTYEKARTITDFEDSKAYTQTRRSTNLHALLNYQHKTPRGTLTLQAEFLHNPTGSLQDKPGIFYHKATHRSNNLTGKIEYKALLFSKITSRGRLNMGEILVGSNFNGVLGSENATFAQVRGYDTPQNRSTPNDDTYYIMPYLTLTLNFGKLQLKATGEYQRFKYLVGAEKQPYSSVTGDFTGKLMAEWHFNKAHNLRLIIDRKLERPSSSQLYPFILFEPQSMLYVKGNPGLKPQTVHEAMVEYLGHLRLASEHGLTLNAALSYNHANRIITSYYPTGSGTAGGLGATLKTLTYTNNGQNHIGNANLMALYTHRAFSLSLVGNLYHKVMNIGGSRGHYTYYNIALFPYFNLKDGWSGGARFVYYSRVAQNDGWLAGQATASMTVGKAWKHFSVYLDENISFLKNPLDVTEAGNQRTKKSSTIIGNVVGIGMRYSF